MVNIIAYNRVIIETIVTRKRKFVYFVEMTEKISKSLHSRPKIMLTMMKMTETNSEMTEKLCPNIVTKIFVMTL